MSERVVVDPITRIEGHLRIEAQMDGDSVAQASRGSRPLRTISMPRTMVPAE